LIILVKDTARRIIRFFSDLYESSAHYVVLHRGARHISAFVGIYEAAISEIINDSIALAESLSREIRTFSYLLHPPLLDQ